MRSKDRQTMLTGLIDNSPGGFLPRLIADDDGRYNEEIIEIVCYQGFGNRAISRKFIEEAFLVILHKLKLSHRNIILPFQIINELFQMEDEFHEVRLRTWLPRIEKLILKALRNEKKNYRILYIITT